MRLNQVLCAVLATAACSLPLLAQSPLPPRRFGITAGVNSATVGGGDVGDPLRRTGLIVGASMIAPASPSVSIEPQVLFTSKGAKFEDSGGGGSISMNYIQIPALVRITAAPSGNRRPFVFGGPAIAFKTSCDLEGLDGTVSASISCDQLEVEGVKFKSVDYGLILGGGLAFDVGGRVFTVSARYDHSLAEIDDASGIKHRVISVMAALEFPWMR